TLSLHDALPILFGYADANGKIPVSIGNHFDEGRGVLLQADANFQQSTAGLQNVNNNRLKEIDEIGNKVVRQKLAPGAQVLVLKNGKVIYDKTFGAVDYENKQSVTQQTIYDLASLSKMLGTLPVVMKMYEDKQIKFEDRLGDLLPEFKNTDKSNITVKELLTHQSGLVAWIPFYKSTLDEDGKPYQTFYKTVFSKEFPTQVSENLYLKAGYESEIIAQIRESKLGTKK